MTEVEVAGRPLSLLYGLLLLVAAQPAYASLPRITVENVSPSLDQTAVAALQSHADNAAREITDWVGPSAATDVRLVLDPKRRVSYTEDPAADGSITIRLPASRIQPANIAGSRLALHHELTHAIAPGAPGKDRLLVEGLAVMVEDRLGTANYPDFERTPDEVVVDLQAKLGRKIPLAESERARLERPDGDERQLAYAQQGSFVGWLVRRYGMAKFLRVYRSGVDYSRGFGKPLDRLERDWRRSLAQAAKQPAR